MLTSIKLRTCLLIMNTVTKIAAAVATRVTRMDVCARDERDERDERRERS